LVYVTFRGNAGQLIRDARLERKWSVAKLSRIAGVSEKLIADIERGRGRNRQDRIVRCLAGALDLRESDLIESPNSDTESRADDPLIGLEFAPYRVRQATLDDLEWIAGNNRFVYQGIDQISFDRMAKWFATNPHGFSILEDRLGNPSGNLDVLPLKPACLRRFLSGEMIEDEIESHDLYSPSEVDEIRHYYVESFVAVTPDHSVSAVGVRTLLMAVPELLNRVGRSRNLGTVFAIGGSASGIQMMKRLGFREIGHPSERADDHSLFEADGAQLCREIRKLAGRENRQFDQLLRELDSSSL